MTCNYAGARNDPDEGIDVSSQSDGDGGAF